MSFQRSATFGGGGIAPGTHLSGLAGSSSLFSVLVGLVRPLGILLIVFSSCMAELSGQDVTGVVVDSISRRPIPDVYLLDSGMKKLTVTDDSGRFVISGLAGSGFFCSHVAYHTTMLRVPNTGNDRHGLLIAMQPGSVQIDSVIISAGLNQRSRDDLPAMARSITARELERTPATSIDLFLRRTPGLNVNRSWGIFSKNASITMRGLTNSASVLVSLDDVPLNKLAGGSVNWNLMAPSAVSRIEVVKGPNSAMYGMNAMGGSVNLESRKPLDSLEGSLLFSAGTYQTKGLALFSGGRRMVSAGEWTWSLNASHRSGKGYVYYPENEPSPYEQSTYLTENNLLFTTGLAWNAHHATSIGFLVSDDKRGEGVQVYEPDGSFNSYTTKVLWLRHRLTSPLWNVSALGFVNLEDYFRQSETINSSGAYQYFDTNSKKGDRGLKVTASFLPNLRGHSLAAGMEVRQGDVVASDVYYSSTDQILYQGNLVFAGVFFQDDYRISPRLNARLSFRYDQAWFSNGRLEVVDPSPVTLFLSSETNQFGRRNWEGFSPRLGLVWHPHPSRSFYLAWSKGFLPPKIEDMTKSGKIRKGFKLANPNLFPERLMNYEAGFKGRLCRKIEIDFSVYVSKGFNFQYFVSQGDSVEVGNEMVALLQKTNIAGVDIYGADLVVEWKPLPEMVILFNLAKNSSKIGQVSGDDPEAKKLIGKFLAEVPETIAAVYADWYPGVWCFSASWTYTGSQWYDDENLELIQAASLFNLKAGRNLGARFYAAVSLEDVLNQRYIDRKGYLSPGRFILADLRFRF